MKFTTNFFLSGSILIWLYYYLLQKINYLFEKNLNCCFKVREIFIILH